MEKTNNRPDWGKLFQAALHEPGRLGSHYRLFHRYSLGNQLLAVEQMVDRGIPVGPIASFNGWRKAGRVVRKGERADVGADSQQGMSRCCDLVKQQQTSNCERRTFRPRRLIAASLAPVGR